MASQSEEIGFLDSKKRMAQLLRKMGKFEAASPIRKIKLQLLDLPVEILKVIISEINHTNDLTALAVTNSTLHSLVIPQMYSRFDIVWPDGSPTNDPRTGVDALAYGLSTLVKSESVFDGLRKEREEKSTTNTPSPEDQRAFRRRRRGNDYAKYTRKFSIGNGHPNMTMDYLITKESGKMLGTLVALALARMVNLEQFIWDMPTGVVQDVWEALASLSGRDDGEKSRLESIWVRFQDSSLTATIRPPSHPSYNVYLSRATLNCPSASLDRLKESYRQIEYPNFSILPPLKSITALEIDQIAYAEELSILIERSANILSELRVGLATPQSRSSLGTITWLYPNAVHEDRDTYASRGGILGMLMSKILDCRRETFDQPETGSNWRQQSSLDPSGEKLESGGPHSLSQPSFLTNLQSSLPTPPKRASLVEQQTGHLTTNFALTTPNDDTPFKLAPGPDNLSGVAEITDLLHKNLTTGAARWDEHADSQPKRKRLMLSVLELERVHLSARILSKAIDFKHLTSLSVLHCVGDDDLWRVLKKAYSAHVTSNTTRHNKFVTTEYPLKLKKIHTNTVTRTLISFLKESLAPDSLEVLFLQNKTPVSTVELDDIYRGPLRRHRGSLKKLIIDSSDKNNLRSSVWKHWVVTGDAFRFITSGKIPHLRELCLNLDFSDWHAFLQSLPNLPRLRSLYIPNFRSSGPGRFPSTRTRELALEILTVITLRPEVELCYLGIMDKCFEILSSSKDDEAGEAEVGQWFTGGMDESETEDEDEDSEAGVTDEDDDHFSGHDDPTGDSDSGENQIPSNDPAYEGMSDGSSSDCGDDPKKPSFKLREILFYSERVEIFKVRSAKL